MNQITSKLETATVSQGKKLDLPRLKAPMNEHLGKQLNASFGDKLLAYAGQEVKAVDAGVVKNKSTLANGSTGVVKHQDAANSEGSLILITPEANTAEALTTEPIQVESPLIQSSGLRVNGAEIKDHSPESVLDAVVSTSIDGEGKLVHKKNVSSGNTEKDIVKSHDEKPVADLNSAAHHSITFSEPAPAIHALAGNAPLIPPVPTMKRAPLVTSGNIPNVTAFMGTSSITSGSDTETKLQKNFGNRLTAELHDAEKGLVDSSAQQEEGISRSTMQEDERVFNFSVQTAPFQTAVSKTGTAIKTDSFAASSVSAVVEKMSLSQASIEQTPQAVMSVQSPGSIFTTSTTSAGHTGGHVQSPAAVSSQNPFGRLDQIDNGSAFLLHGNANKVAFGIHDSSMGWIEVRTQSTAGEISATLATSSSQTHTALSAQLPSLSQYLTDQNVRVSNLGVEQGFSQTGGNLDGGMSSSKDTSQGQTAPNHTENIEREMESAIKDMTDPEQLISYISVRV